MKAADLDAAFASLPPAWTAILPGWTRGRLDAVRRGVEAVSGDRPIAPDDPFRALRLVAPDDVKVVIIGQDPYPTAGHADGLAFSADEKTFYVADSGRSHDPEAPHHIRAFNVGPKGKLSKGRVLCDVDPGVPDGFRLDVEGNLWISCGDGIVCVAADGTPLGKIKVPQAVANLTFGGPKRNRLFITATTSVYSIIVTTNGIQVP